MQAQAVDIAFYKEIPLINSDRPALVDGRDYKRLASFTWRKRINNRKAYAYRNFNGKEIFMHREILNYYSSSNYFSDIRHVNGNTLDNRKSNLRPLYSTICTGQTHFYPSEFVQKEIRKSLEHYRNLSVANVIDSDGIILRSNIAKLINQSADELDYLLAQRLKAVQLILEARGELLSLKQQVKAASEQIDGAIASLDSTISSLQPK